MSDHMYWKWERWSEIKCLYVKEMTDEKKTCVENAGDIVQMATRCLKKRRRRRRDEKASTLNVLAKDFTERGKKAMSPRHHVGSHSALQIETVGHM